MSDPLTGLLFNDPTPEPPAGKVDRFGGRWRLVGAGLSNVWRYGDLDLPAPSGRLLLRGQNGTGKTTALEALWPYLLDLDPSRLAAGKARPTTLKLLMSEGAEAGKKRYGYAWLTFAPPDDIGEEPEQVTFGVRLQWSRNASPEVRVIPFTVPARPLHDVPLCGPNRRPFEHDEFVTQIVNAGGTVFDDEDDYVDHFAARVWRTSAGEVRQLAQRLRSVRNPTLLAATSADAAAEALRATLPGVDESVINATAEALASSQATREAFDLDKQASEVLTDFESVWAGHVADVAGSAYTAALDAATALGQLVRQVGELERAERRAARQATDTDVAHGELVDLKSRLSQEIRAIEVSPAYRTAGQIATLTQQLNAEQRHADSLLDRVRLAARVAARETDAAVAALGERREDLDGLAQAAASAGGELVDTAGILRWNSTVRQVALVGGMSADPGSGLVVHHDPSMLSAAADSWHAAAQRSDTTADHARVAITTHRAVAKAQADAATAQQAATRAAEAFESQQQATLLATANASLRAGELSVRLADWSREQPDLCATLEDGDGAAPADLPEWDGEDVEAAAASEPAQLLAVADSWAQAVGARAEHAAASAEQQARSADTHAAELTTQATALRLEAEELRAGRLLPLPRPGWVPAGSDDAALGAALEWRADALGADARAAAETALAASGVLAATLTADGATSAAWRVEVSGPIPPTNLSTVLTVDDTHPLAHLARKVLTRIAWAPTAAHDAAHTALVIGADGSYRAGVLYANPVAVPGQLRAATYVGARQRRQAALARAAELETEADSLAADASRLEDGARLLRQNAHAVRDRGRSFPDRAPLRGAEAKRAAAADQERGLADESERKGAEAVAKHERARAEADTWRAQVTVHGLPTDLDALATVERDNRAAAKTLREAGRDLKDRLAARIARAVAAAPDEAALAQTLAVAAGEAVTANEQVTSTQTLLDELNSDAADVAEEVARHARLTDELKTVSGQVPAAESRARLAGDAHVRAVEKLDQARENVRAARPRQMATSAHLTALLSHPAVAEILQVPAQLPDGDELLELADTLLTGRHTHRRAFVADRADQARAALARSWILARADAGPGLDELDTFVLTHAEQTYTPAQAAARAREIADRAARKLAAAEQTALTDFVVGRLPNAIGAAWTRLQDWRSDVNRKMRSASASSGVGVQVQISLRDDLSVPEQTVYELSCTVAAADRTDEQKAAVGEALQALLHAADGATMAEKVAAAADIREWITVNYMVSRPSAGGEIKQTRWSRRTGLSGGERRLVILAPMLAAVAASYDGYGPAGARLVPLDEVPAEVDERGREGLARYLAHLDLDVVCTSYLWDGAPGAWDGVDAWDLEAGLDGTVVGFPMLVRGLDPLPGEKFLAR